MKIREFKKNVEGQDFYYLSNFDSLEAPLTKPIVLFLHGHPDNAHIWKHQLDFFKDQAHVISLHFWGTLKGEKYKKENYSVLRYPLLIETFLKSLNIPLREMFLVAHDIAGPIAYELSQNIQNKHLIFFNTLSSKQFISRFKNIKQLLKSSYMLLFQVPLLNKKTLAPICKPVLKNIYRFGRCHDSQEIELENPNVFSSYDFYRQFAKDISRIVKRHDHPLETPTTVIAFKDDPFILPPNHDELSTHFKNYDLNLYENGGHWAQVTQKDLLNQKLKEVIH